MTHPILEPRPKEPELFPAEIAVTCDGDDFGCETLARHDYIVASDMTTEQRYEVARASLRARGWICNAGGDWCPAHKHEANR